MGLFKKDNPFLPVAKSRLYPEYFFPDSNKIPIVNFDWYETCLENLGKTGKQVWNPNYCIEAIDFVMEFPNVMQNIQNRVNGLAEIIINNFALIKERQFVEDLNNRLFLGGGLAYDEHFSGLSISGLIHPSIANAISFTKTKDEKRDDFYIGHALDKAVEVGYGVARFSKEPIDKFILNLKRVH